MPDSLYQKAIMGHAKAAVGAGALEDATVEATVDNPLCGDRVTVGLKMEEDRIAAIGHVVRGCVLCEASASLLAQHGIGLTADDIRAVDVSLQQMIREDGPVPDGWPDLASFEPVRSAKSRHECVLLPFEAATRALSSKSET